jgi:hypothetical protein
MKTNFEEQTPVRKSRRKNLLDFLFLDSGNVDGLDLVVDLLELFIKSVFQKVDNVLDKRGSLRLDFLDFHSLDKLFNEGLDLAGLLIHIGPVLLHLDNGLAGLGGLVQELVTLTADESGVDHVETINFVGVGLGELDGGSLGSGLDEDNGDVGVGHQRTGKVRAGGHFVDGLGDGRVDQVVAVARSGDVVSGMGSRLQKVSLLTSREQG